MNIGAGAERDSPLSKGLKIVLLSQLKLKRSVNCGLSLHYVSPVPLQQHLARQKTPHFLLIR